MGESWQADQPSYLPGPEPGLWVAHHNIHPICGLLEHVKDLYDTGQQQDIQEKFHEEDDGDTISHSILGEDRVKEDQAQPLKERVTIGDREERVAMIPVTLRGKGDRGRDRGASRAHRTIHRKWKGSFQTFGKEVCITGHSVSPSLRTVLQECMCCQCYARFGGHLPVPRADALLPYWVPLSLRPRKQVSKMIRRYTPRAIRSCRCPCHCFGGCLPMPRDRAVMPYWVPQGLRSQKKVVKRLENVKDTPECSLESSSWHGCWRVCGDQHLLLKWQQLQALHQDELPGPQEDEPHAGRLGLLLPMSFNLLTLLQAVLRAILAIRHLFWD